MTQIFQDPLHDEFGTWSLAYIPYGGADFGEIDAVAQAVGSGDDDVYYEVLNTFADRLNGEAESALVENHHTSARDLFLRASVFYAASYHPFYGSPVQPKLLNAFHKQVRALDRGFSLFDPPIIPTRIPFLSGSMPAYLIPASGKEKEIRPLIIFTNGYDGTITDMYFASAVAASKRGYHCLLFDGPGQGEMLYEQGISIRPDWENVITAVVDFVITQPNVDPTRIALSGWSLGGYLAPRAASGEHRLAALIADPGTWGIASGFREVIIRKFGVSREAAANLGDLDEAIVSHFDEFIRKDRYLNWKIVQRGFWVHGVNNLRDYLRSTEDFTMDSRADLIQCPTLLTMAEDDSLGAFVPSFFEQLCCPKTLLRFSAMDGAGSHCEMRNRSRLNRKSLDWLDEQFTM